MEEKLTPKIKRPKEYYPCASCGEVKSHWNAALLRIREGEDLGDWCCRVCVNIVRRSGISSIEALKRMRSGQKDDQYIQL